MGKWGRRCALTHDSHAFWARRQQNESERHMHTLSPRECPDSPHFSPGTVGPLVPVILHPRRWGTLLGPHHGTEEVVPPH